LEEAISIAARNATTFKMISAEGRLGKVKWCDPYEEDYEV
jgi:hypothetical protein